MLFRSKYPKRDKAKQLTVVLRDAKVRATHSLDLLPGHRALRAARPLLGVLVHELTSCKHDESNDQQRENLSTSRSEAAINCEKIV